MDGQAVRESTRQISDVRTRHQTAAIHQGYAAILGSPTLNIVASDLVQPNESPNEQKVTGHLGGSETGALPVEFDSYFGLPSLDLQSLSFLDLA